jgi:hypothetical protein
LTEKKYHGRGRRWLWLLPLHGLLSCLLSNDACAGTNRMVAEISEGGGGVSEDWGGGWGSPDSLQVMSWFADCHDFNVAQEQEAKAWRFGFRS